ncbi:MAG: hypothetical protein AB9M53_01030 [Leptothrix sp. (in: b-proteobacteria)]
MIAASEESAALAGSTTDVGHMTGIPAGTNTRSNAPSESPGENPSMRVSATD